MPKINLKKTEIPTGTLIRLDNGETSIVLIRTNGKVNAFLDRCPHAHWPLSEGALAGQVLECLGHGWRFDLSTGECLTVPNCALKRLAVTIIHDRLQIEWD